MAATISTGSATSNVDLLQKLITWLITRGYTSNMSQSDGNGWRAHLSKNGIYVNLKASLGSDTTWASVFSGTTRDGINLYLGSGINVNTAWNAQPGAPTQNGNSNTVGSFAYTGAGAIVSYQFIDDGNDNIFIIIQAIAGIYSHLCWGTLVKYGAWTGGLFFSGTMAGYYGYHASFVDSYSSRCPFSPGVISNGDHQAFVRADIDSFTGKWLCNGVGTTIELGYTGKFCSNGIAAKSTPSTSVPIIDEYTRARLVSSISARIRTVPIVIYAQRDSGGYSPIGDVPSMRLCVASEAGIAIGSDVTIGAETWRIFNGFALRIA